MGLRLRLVLWLLVPALAVMATYAYLRLDEERAARQAEFTRRAEVASAGVRLATERVLADGVVADVDRLATDLVARHTDIVRVRLFDGSLRTLVDRSLVADDPGPPEALVRQVLQSGQQEASSRRVGRLALYSTIVPVRPRAGPVGGALELVYLQGRLGRELRDLPGQVATEVGLVCLVLIGLGGFALRRLVLRPLDDLTTATERIATGALDASVPVRRPDEFGRLAGSFNTMVGQLERARQEREVESERSADLSAQLLRTESVATAGRLCWGLAHEVGTPLNIITGRAELGLQGLPAKDRLREDFQVILAQTERIATTIRSTLDPFQPHQPNREPVRLAPTLETVLPLLRQFARSRSVALTVGLPADLPPVLVDAAHLQHVVVNLMMSAIDLTPPGGRVTLQAERRAPSTVLLSVTDTGPPIPADMTGRVFTPFVSVRRSERGPGLSVAVSQDLMKQNGIDVRVESTSDAGTIFTVPLPVFGGEHE